MENRKYPNIVLINCDDMGYGDLGCYGSKVNRTPFIDSLAAEGIRFTSCYSASPVCSPSRAALMTGCYPPRVAINRVLFPGDNLGLNPKEYTIAGMLGDKGYHTMIIGKWHCGDQKEFLPLQFGFDEYYGLPYSNDMGRQGGQRSMDFPPLPLIEGDEVVEQQPDQVSLTERYTEQAVKFIRRNKTNPFFLYFAHMHVHLPLYANKVFYKDSQNGDFGACMSEVDWACKVVVNELKQQNIYEDTLIIFTSDNGSRADHGASNAPLRGTKFETWEGGMRVPCVMHWKGHIKPGQVSGHIISNIDFMALFAHLAKVPLSNVNKNDSVDIYDTVFKNKPTREKFIYFGQNDRQGKTGQEETAYLCAVREGKYKLHLQRLDKKTFEYRCLCELYDLEKDIGEQNNIAEQEPDMVKQLTHIADSYKKILGDQGSNIYGSEVRGCGMEENPVFLCNYDENHPYIINMYDKSDRG